MSVNKKVIKVEDLRVYFHTKKGDSKAVDGNHFTMYENETLAIVGESGCGKSVTAMSILGLVSESRRNYAWIKNRIYGKCRS